MGLLATLGHRALVERLSDWGQCKTVRLEIEVEAESDLAYLELVWAV